jgi:hypothetical protein
MKNKTLLTALMLISMVFSSQLLPAHSSAGSETAD